VCCRLRRNWISLAVNFASQPTLLKLGYPMKCVRSSILKAFDLGGLLLATITIGLGGMQSRVRYISNLKPHNVVVAAHQDDWQLFMGDVVTAQARAGNGATFIYLTAGDDGRDSLYWEARERAALLSTRIAIGAGQDDSLNLECSVVSVLEHSIRECVAGNTHSYFLRLPDGNRNGAGFAVHNYQSLRKLRQKNISAIAAVDGSATYYGWNDLAVTLSTLVTLRSSAGTEVGARRLRVHTTDPNIVVNPHDHFDHRMAGLLVADLRKKEGWDVRYYVGYALATRAANRSNEQVRDKTAVFLAYEREMTRTNKAWGAYGERPSFYSQCMLRTYARNAAPR